MSDFYGANYTLQYVNVPSEKIGVGEQYGRVHVAYDSYSFSAALTTSDVLYMMKVPKGARILDLRISCDDLGTTGDFNIGWQAGAEGLEAADADGFFAALDVNAAAIHTSILASGLRPAGLFKKFSEEVQLVIVPSENTTATSGSVQLVLEYVLD